MAYDETEQVPITEPYTPNKTIFHSDKIPDGSRYDGYDNFYWYYKVLRNLNKGTHQRSETNPYELWTDREWLRHTDNLGMFDAVSCQLDLTDGQKRWGRKRFGQLDLKKYSSPYDKGTGSVLAAFCVCAYICWRNGRKTHPNNSEMDERFTKFMDESKVSDKKFRKWYGRVENDIRSGNRQTNETGVYKLTSTIKGSGVFIKTHEQPRQQSEQSSRVRWPITG